MRYIEPPSQPRPKKESNKIFVESKQEMRDRKLGMTIGLLTVVCLLLCTIFGWIIYQVLFVL